MTKKEHIKTYGRQFISKRSIKAILVSVLGEGVTYPICRQYATTHAAGLAVVGLAARTAKEDVRHIRNSMDLHIGEMIRENIFTYDKLRDYILRTEIIRNAFRRSLAPRSSSSTGNPGIQVLLKLPSQHMNKFNEIITHVEDCFDQASSHMNKVYIECATDKMRTRNQRIRELLSDKIPAYLFPVIMLLDELDHSMDLIAECVRMGWEADARESCKLCRA